ncbi:unnamed protein product, partial [Effrenium voratum]
AISAPADLPWPGLSVGLAMATVTIALTGRVVMSAEEFQEWWDKHAPARDSVCFYDALRQEVARREQLKNFRQLQLATSDGAPLTSSSPWQLPAESVTAVKRELLTTRGKELQDAVKLGDAASVILLLEEPQDPTKALDAAVQSDQLQILRRLLEAGADKDVLDMNYFTPMHTAAMSGHEEIVRCLLAAGAAPDKSDRFGNRPLHGAAYYGHPELARLLLEAGADKDSSNNHGRTPMHNAAMNGHEKVVRVLLEAGADKEKADMRRTTPMQSARQRGHKEVVRCLQDAGKAGYAS